MDHPVASVYLWATAGFFLCVFAVPLLVMPLRWARWFRWNIPAETALTVYFGRCVGVVAVALSVGWIRAAPHPAAHPLVFEITIAAAALMTVIHAVGALERSQPWTETAEIPMYLGFTIATLALYLQL